MTKKSVGAVLMERYIRMQTLHTATLQALTGESKALPLAFDLSLLSDQVMSEGDRATFDKSVAEAVAGQEKSTSRNLV